jgi:hypothetical protein
LGVDAFTLGHSVESFGSPGSGHPCRHLGGRRWRCERYYDPISGQALYAVRVGSSGCWTATRLKFNGNPSRERLSGCVTIVDHILG